MRSPSPSATPSCATWARSPRAAPTKPEELPEVGRHGWRVAFFIMGNRGFRVFIEIVNDSNSSLRSVAEIDLNERLE